jgi:hypothetical protein
MNKTTTQAVSKSMPKRANTFIKVVEIWNPTGSQNNLVLMDGIFDHYENFRVHSQKRSFAYDEGLPGKAWSAARPILISNIAYSFFRRKEAAVKAGLSTGIAIPIFAGDFLQAVVVFLCGEDEQNSGAIELWGTHTEHDTELNLIDGYYGNQKRFEWVSRQLTFTKGTGLPGIVWQTRMPVIIPDLRTSKSFVRANIADEVDITTGLGIPFCNKHGNEYTLTLFSALGTTIARHFEIWIPDENQQKLTLLSSHTDSDNCDFVQDITTISRGQGLTGTVWMTGRPAISHNLYEDGLLNDESETNLDSALVMPINADGKLKAVINLYF